MYQVLYVDDDPDLLLIGKKFIERSKEFLVDTNTSANNVLDSVDLQSYDAIISDYQMPGIDGIEFLKKVRLKNVDIPFILFTGKGREEVVIEAINSGADFYIQKGNDTLSQFAELTHKIRQSVRRREAELARIKSEKKFFEVFFKNPSISMINSTEDGTFIDVNNAFLKKIGYSREEVIGKKIDELEIFADQNTLVHIVNAIHENGSIRDNEIEINTKSGEKIIAHLSCERIQIGNQDLFFSYAIDITEEKKAQEALLDSEEKYKLIAENSHDLVYIYRDTGFLFFNQKIPLVTGYTSEELKKINVWDLLPPGDREVMYEYAIKRIAGEAIPSHYFAHYLTKSGEIRDAEFTMEKITFQGEYALLGTVRDITERKKQEASLYESEQRYRTLVETTDTGYVILDKSGCVIDANIEYIRLTGYSKLDDIKGRSILEWTSPDEEERNKEALLRCIRDGKIRNFEINYIHLDGKLTLVEINATVVKANESFQIVTLCHDISSRF